MAYKYFPADQPCPGTQLIQRVDWTARNSGMGAYFGTPTFWSTPAAQSGIRGLGCGCGCGGNCADGFGLFDTGLDVTGWGWQEWGIAFFGLYAVISIFSTTSRATRAVKSYPGERRKKRAAKLRAEAKALSKQKGFFG